MDIRINSENMIFKYRVNAIIIKDGKVLLVSMNHSPHFCCSGGHVELGETSEQAIIRETMEEVGLKPANCRLIAVMENFFPQTATGKPVHELSHYYIVNIENIPAEKMKSYDFLEHDKDKMVNLHFEWIPLAKLDDYNIKPLALKEILNHLDAHFIHIVLQNEKITQKEII